MDIKKIIVRRMSAGKPSFPKALSVSGFLRYFGNFGVFSVLMLASWLYRGLVQTRLLLYQRGALTVTEVPCPVISIGNISTGGTGKTPMVILIVKILQQHGKHVIVLSRGYLRKGNSNQMVMLPPGGESAAVEMVGDEPLLIAQKIMSADLRSADIPVGEKFSSRVVVSRKRAQAAQLTLAEFHPDVFVLDDGFQHVQLVWICDLVLIDATNPFGGGYMLPAGFLREPLKNLRRADVFVITRSDEVDDVKPIRDQIRRIQPDAPIFTARHAFDELRDIATGEAIDLENLRAKRMLAVCGLANPVSFHRLLGELRIAVAETLDFPDHHWFSVQDVEQIGGMVTNQQLDAIVTTEKDGVRLKGLAERLTAPVYAVAIALKVEPSRAFEDVLFSACQQSPISSA